VLAAIPALCAAYDAEVSEIGDIHETARGFFLCKVANGGVPATVAGGVHDGLRYFIIEFNGETYWLTEGGLRVPRLEDGELVLSEDPYQR
jgi:hypothetical protein